jgi:hypothetical protein
MTATTASATATRDDARELFFESGAEPGEGDSRGWKAVGVLALVQFMLVLDRTLP